MLTSDTIWEGLMKDHEFAAQPEAVKAAMRPFIDAMPALLADLEDKPASLQSIMDAKLRFLRYCVDHDFITRVVDAMSEDGPGFFSKDMLKEQFASLFASLVEMLEPLAKDVQAFLRENGINEDELMRGPQVGLVGEARRLYEAGQLTIGQLLEHQPSIIVSIQS